MTGELVKTSNMNKRFSVFSTTITLLIISSGLSVLACGEGKSRLPDNREKGRGSGIAVDALVIRPQPLENRIFTTGTLLANEEVELRPETSGRVTGVFFDEGGKVRKGQLLLKINDSELQAQLRRKELEEKLASDEQQRKKSLFEMKGISQEEYDKATNNLEMIRAERDVIKSQLAKTEVLAPFDGVIGLRHVSEGSYVTNNMLVATMQDIDPVKVEFSVPEKYAGDIKKGLDVMVRVGDSGIDHKGVVHAVEAKIDPGTRTIKARATIPNPHDDLIPGSFARVEITLNKIPDAIVVPSGAVVPELNGEVVFVCRDGVAHRTSVKTGIRTESETQITGGLAPGDTLAVTGLLQLSHGAAVEIKNLGDESAASK